jgi:hypothetical protein
MTVFWDVAACSLVEIGQRFKGACCLHHQGDHRPDSHLHIRRCENLKSHLEVFIADNALFQTTKAPIYCFINFTNNRFVGVLYALRENEEHLMSPFMSACLPVASFITLSTLTLDTIVALMPLLN